MNSIYFILENKLEACQMGTPMPEGSVVVAVSDDSGIKVLPIVEDTDWFLEQLSLLLEIPQEDIAQSYISYL